MSICIKDQIQNMNLVIGCTVGCAYCYARNNVKRWHMIDDFTDPEFFPGKLRMMEKSLKLPIPDIEIGYLAMHLERMLDTDINE